MWVIKKYLVIDKKGPFISFTFIILNPLRFFFFFKFWHSMNLTNQMD